MDIYRISVEGPNKGNQGELLQRSDTVKLVRMVTMEYIVNVADYLDKPDELVITVQALIQREMDTIGISDVLDNEGKTSIVDDVVIAVE